MNAPLPIHVAKQLQLDIHHKLIVDLFAGGGGMSVAFEMAFGRSPDIAINHNDDALSMHRANHPLTRHFIADVFEVCPHAATQDRPVGWLHLSPDCTDHSQASGGQPRSKKIRGLSWVGYRWAAQVHPDVISLENVKQILRWGRLIAKRDPATGRCLKRAVDTKGRAKWDVAEKGERVPVQDQYLIPDPKREGQTWRKFVRALESLGYHVEHKKLVAASLGGHTTRERLFMIARRDGLPIVWPEATHFKKPTGKQKKWKPAADCIDFTDLGNSIFDRPKPLADATMRRIAKGIKRYVLDNPEPFIVNSSHGGKIEPLSDPISTIATENGGCRALVTPTLVPVTHQGHDRVYSVEDPFRTITAAHRGETMLASPIMVHAGHGEGSGKTRRRSHGIKDVQEPIGTVVASGGGHALATAFISRQFGTAIGHGVDESLRTCTAGGGGGKSALVECVLSQEEESGAQKVAAFLMKYYSEGGQWSELDKPLDTITTRDRLALVTVFIQNTPYVIVDIRLRMLKPRELFNGQDFPPDYIIERGHDGRKFSISAQTRMCGNSVDPVMGASILTPNAPTLAIKEAA